MADKIAVLVGSLRKGSFSRKMAQALTDLALDTLSLEAVEIGDLPHDNQDLETEAPPPAWVAFRDAIKAVDRCCLSRRSMNTVSSRTRTQRLL